MVKNILKLTFRNKKAINPLYKRYNNDKYCKSDTEKFRKLNPEGQTKSEKVPHIALI